MQAQANAQLGGYSGQLADWYDGSAKTRLLVDLLRRYGRPASVSATQEHDQE